MSAPHNSYCRPWLSAHITLIVASAVLAICGFVTALNAHGDEHDDDTGVSAHAHAHSATTPGADSDAEEHFKGGVESESHASPNAQC